MADRKSFYDTKRYNPIQKASSTVGSYFKNVGKEAKDFVRTWSQGVDANSMVGPGTDKKASELRVQQDKELGQLVGAVVQGRRYDKKGNQIKK